MPDGHVPASGRLTRVVIAGCVPVIISHRAEPAFQGILDWRDVAVFVPDTEADLRALPDLLHQTPQPSRSRAIEGGSKPSSAASPWS